MFKLYTYWRSTAAYRVRIALNLKQLDYESISIHLVKDSGEQHSASYRNINPQGLVPALALDDGTVISQSLAIMEYLDEIQPAPALLPKSVVAKSRCRAMAQVIVSDIHPLNNLRILKYLKEQGWQQDKVDQWYQHWIHQGFQAIESQLQNRPHKFTVADYPCLSDICLVAQIYNADRFNVPLEAYPQIQQVHGYCAELDAFADARPENQPDANS